MIIVSFKVDAAYMIYDFAIIWQFLDDSRKASMIATLSKMSYWMLNDTKMRNDAGRKERNAVDVFSVDGRYRNINWRKKLASRSLRMIDRIMRNP